MAQTAVPEGKYTETIYTMIKDQKYADAIKILDIELQSFPRSRAALSLLGHCYYMLQDYANAVAMYELLVTFYGEVEEYKVYYAQSLYKAGMYAEATRAALRVEGEQYRSEGETSRKLRPFWHVGRRCTDSQKGRKGG